MNCCRTNRQSSYDPEACSGSGSRSSPGTCSELVLLVGLHNFFNLDLMHRGRFKLSIDLSVVDGGSGEGSTSKRRGRANRSLPLAECEVELAMDSPGNPSASSSPEKGGEMPSEKKDHGDGPPRKSHAHGKDLRTFSAPFYIEYIEQDVLIQKTAFTGSRSSTTPSSSPRTWSSTSRSTTPRLRRTPSQGRSSTRQRPPRRSPFATFSTFSSTLFRCTSRRAFCR